MFRVAQKSVKVQFQKLHFQTKKMDARKTLQIAAIELEVGKKWQIDVETIYTGQRDCPLWQKNNFSIAIGAPIISRYNMWREYITVM